MIPAHVAAWALKKKKDDDDMATQRRSTYVGGRDASQGAPYGYSPNQNYQGGRDAYNPQYVRDPAPAGMMWTPGTRDQAPTLVAKGGGSPRVPSAMEQAQASNWLAQQEADRQAKATADAKAAKDAADAATRATAATKNTAAYNTARGYGTTQAASSGYNQDLLKKYGVLDAFYADLENQKSGIDPMDITPTYNANTPWANAVATGQGRYRSDTEKAINAAAGTGFEQNLIGDTMDDTILNTILSGQKENAFNQIDMAYKRGQLSAGGYENALKQLETANTAGMGELQKIGGGVLGGYRTGLTNQKNQALTTAGGLTLADTYDINAFNKALTGAVNTAKTNLSGDIYSAVGEQQFFDPTKMIGLAGAQQGYYNPVSPAPAAEGGAVSPLMQQMTEEEKKRLQPSSTVF